MSNDFDPSILIEMLDRPIAYQRCFVTISKSVTAAVMLSQAVYWAKRTTDPDKWFWKSQLEWEEETGLTRSEQETARKKLAAIGVLEEKKQGLPCRLYFRVNTKKLYSQLIESSNQTCNNQPNQYAEIPQTSDRNLCVLEGGVPANNLYTEITSESTAKIESLENFDLHPDRKTSNLSGLSEPEDPKTPPLPPLSVAAQILQEKFEGRFKNKPNRHAPQGLVEAGFGEWHLGGDYDNWRPSLIKVAQKVKRELNQPCEIKDATKYLYNTAIKSRNEGHWGIFQAMAKDAIALEKSIEQSQARSQPQTAPQPIELVVSPPPAHLRERFRVS
jgi:hypothetical protein